jgi:uncharacterized protein
MATFSAKRIKHLIWLWAIASRVCPGRGIVPASQRIRFVLKSLAVHGSLAPLIDAPKDSPLGKLMSYRPETVGAAIWPYQCSGWNAQTRFARIRDHYAVVEKIGGIIDFPVDGRVALLDLRDIRDDFHVVLEQPTWFMREGQLSISLFLGERRLYTLAFSLFQDGTTVAAFIGALQGRDIEGALDRYRELTKAAHGMRPRDLLFEIFRMLCSEIGVKDILAVSEDFRHHKDRKYFGQSVNRTSASYDEIWKDRGGIRVDPMFFQLSVTGSEKDLAAIPAKKRGMYRQRFEMLRSIRRQMHEKCSSLNSALIVTPSEQDLCPRPSIAAARDHAKFDG